MPAIKPSCVRDLKNRVNLSDVVSRVATLKKVGARWRALCPFHAEKTPSFYVDADKGFYKCFGCGKAGDIISFVRETEQLTFTEAVEALGQRFGVPIEYEAGAGPSREELSLRQELFDLHEAAAEFFREMFLAPGATGDFMRAYWMEKRRFPLELADEFKIGAAAPDDTGLGARLLKKKFSEDALRQSGLFFVRDTAVLTLASLRPRFRGRLMIPIRDHQGRVVAFTARQTDLTPADDPAREAKYVNSPETPIFTKGNLLFNLDRARSHASEGRPFVLVEGQLDAMRCWHVGLKTAVAPQGTAITESQLALLRRYTPQVECFFDGDSAGQKAALRFLPMALRAGLEIKFLGLAGAEKTDPDVLFLERGLAAYDELRRDALNAMAFACRALLPAPAAASSEEKARATQTIFELVAAAESEVARAGFLSEVAEYLRLPLSALQKDFEAFRRRGARVAAPAAPPESNPPPADGSSNSITPEHELISFCLNFDELFQTNIHRIHYEWLDKNSLASSTLSKILVTSNEGEWLGAQSINEIFESDNERRLVASLMFDAPMHDNPKAILEEIIRKLESRYLASRLKAIEATIAEKGPSQDEELFRLMVEHGKICQQMSKIRSQAMDQSRA